MNAAARLADALREIVPDARAVADGEWGLRLDAGGWPLDVGVALDASRTLVRAQGEVCGPGQADPHALLHRARLTPLVKLTQSREGAVWVEGYIPASGLDATELDRLLGLLVQCADAVRYSLPAARRARSR